MANLSNINNKFLVTTGGNVGIGVTGPVVKLELQDTTHTTMKIRSGNNDNILFLQAIQGQDGRIGTETNNDLGFYTNGTDRLTISNTGNATFAGEVTLSAETQYLNFKKASTADVLASIISETDAGTGGKIRILTKRNGDTAINALTIDDNQNVGIGTATPQKKVHIEGTGGASEMQILVSSASDTVGHTAGIGLRGEGGEADGDFRIKGGIFFERIAGSFGNGKMILAVNSSVSNTSVTVADHALTIDTNKNVGIGTTSPVSVLEVYGGSSGTNDIDRYVRFKASNGEKRFDFYMGGTGNASSLGMYTSDGTTKNVQISAGGTSYLNAGNVGIGTTSPAAKLQSVQTTSGEWTGGFKNYTSNGYGLRVDMSGSSSVQAALQVYTGSGTGFVVKNSGVVGIGTFTPGAKLEISGIRENQIRLTSYDTTAAVDEIIGGVEFYSSDTGNEGVKASISAIAANTEGSAYMTFSTGTNTERMRIDSSGRVEVKSRVLSIDAVDEYRENFTTTGNATPSFDIDVKSIGASGQPFEVFVAWTHYSTSYGAGLHQAYYQRSTVQSNITLIHTYFNQTSTLGGAWSVSYVNATTIRVSKSAGTHAGAGYGYIRVTRLKP